MKHHDHFHCAICAAQFDSSDELQRHERARHTQQGVSGISPSNEYESKPGSTAEPDATKRDPGFTRRNPE